MYEGWQVKIQVSIQPARPYRISLLISEVHTSSGTNGNDEQKPPLLLNGTIEEACDHKLDQIKFPSVKSWTKKGWQEQYPLSTSAVPGSSSKKSACGSRQMAQGINVSTYLQDKNGLAPESIGQASLDVLKWLVHTLHKTHIKLRLCADNWKIMKLMTDNYPQWHKYHTKKRSSDQVKAEAYQDLEEEIILDSILTATQKQSSSEPDNEHAIKRSRMDSDISEEATQSMTALSCDDIMRDPSPDREPTPPPSTNKGKGKEVNIFRARIYQKPSCTLVPIPEVPSTADATSLAVKMEVIAATQHTEQTKIAINCSKPDAIKKRQPSTKPMRVSAKITACNLCAFDWQSNGHQKEPVTVFASYWNGLSKTDKDVYKCKATAQLKSSGVAATIHDVDEE
ncbi:uncharacterized protein EDB91DRAFT_1082318 [Suillus paluster]|uniref:uncharacterized protein n=1 Tax=Suillus paluster TaxID=48578 RepID=UPI001B86B5B4|nr:uncharacterized protein EDB91DRAFT_1082318 [Suillus paluster]KAG1739954.1 hypothetical protein EDB91DRAFT_1082318 [Suillus paluster]